MSDKSRYFSDSDYDGSQSDCDGTKLFSHKILCAIFEDDNVDLLQKALQFMSPNQIYKMISVRCFVYIDDDDGGHRPHDSINCFKYLIQQGLDINCQDEYGNTPLHHACIYNDRAIYYILRKGGNPNIKCSQGRTPIHCYVMGHTDFNHRDESSADIDFLKEAISRGFDVKSVDINGNSCLHLYQTRKVDKFITVLDLFIENDFDINMVNNRNMDIIASSQKYFPNVVEQLIPELFKRGFNFYSRDLPSIVEMFNQNERNRIMNLIEELHDQNNHNEIKQPEFD